MQSTLPVLFETKELFSKCGKFHCGVSTFYKEQDTLGILSGMLTSVVSHGQHCK